MKRIVMATALVVFAACGGESTLTPAGVGTGSETRALGEARGESRDAREEDERAPERDREAEPTREREAPAQAVCGLYRGGLDDAENLIASPNPPESVADTDEDCAEYCRASGTEAGDVCVRAGAVIETYGERPEELVRR
jgi:hypothetical protein